MSNIDKMTANEQLFTELTPAEGSAISGGEDKSSTSINLKLPDSYTLPDENHINFNPPPPKKSEDSNDKDKSNDKTLVPGGGNIGIYGDFLWGTPIAGVTVRFP